MSLSRTRPFVLLVEDSDDDAFFFQRALRKCEGDFDVLRVNDGIQAIRFFESCFGESREAQAIPEYVFLDLKLPILSGFEILQWLTDRKILPQLNISILSGSESLADIRRGAELGVSDYLVKPVPVSDLRSRLFRVARRPSDNQEEFSAS